jgi:uncharacterized protein (TIGR02996 family)
MLIDDATFFRAICDDPDDDTLRLVYADFLQESSDPVRLARAEFIHVQCELAYLPSNDPRWPALQEREDALLAAYRRAWNGPVHRRLHAGPLRGQVRSRRGLIRGWRYRRGFIAEVTAHATVVIQHADELLALGPLERLRVREAHGSLAALLAAPLLAGVRELDLSNNGLTGRESRRLMADVRRMTQLHWLDLRGNRFGLRAMADLTDALHERRLPPLTLLR